MEKLKIWMDCDPGIDDAVALAMAAASKDKLELLGISTVAGNQTSDRVTGNALRLASFLGLEDVPVARGAREPLLRAVETAEEVHGETGLGNCRLPDTQKETASENAVPYLAERILSLPEGEKLTLVPTGPLTNIALLFKTFPQVKERIERIVLMGGASNGGNQTATAEFNIWVDPEAAKIVFQAGLPIVMCGLDVTNRSGLDRAQVAALCGSEKPVERACGEMLDFYCSSAEEETVGIHDAVTILYLTDPEMFGGRYVSVDVDCTSDINRGMTVCDKRRKAELGKNPVFMLDRVDLPAFQKVLLSKLASL